jgi:hypothetical protein
MTQNIKVFDMVIVFSFCSALPQRAVFEAAPVQHPTIMPTPMSPNKLKFIKAQTAARQARATEIRLLSANLDLNKPLERQLND